MAKTMWEIHLEKGAEGHLKDMRKRACGYMKRYKRNNRAKVNARKRVYDAVGSGRLKRGVCHCGETRVEAHHPNYSKPLEVLWLCKKHHTELI